MGEGEGREEKSCLVHTKIIRPPFSLEFGGFLFSANDVYGHTFLGHRSVNQFDPQHTHRTLTAVIVKGKEACSVGCGKIRDCEGGEEAVGEGDSKCVRTRAVDDMGLETWRTSGIPD